MKNKTIIIGTVLAVFIMLITPSISAINVKIENDTIKEKTKEFSNDFNQIYEIFKSKQKNLEKIIREETVGLDFHIRLLGLFGLFISIYSIFVWYCPISPFFYIDIILHLQRALDTKEPFLQLYIKSTLGHLLPILWELFASLYMIITGEYCPYDPTDFTKST